MDAILAFFTFIQGLGVSVMMPIILTIIGTVLGAGFGKSLKAGLTVGVGFIGLNLVINNVLGTNLAPAVEEMTTRFGLASTSSMWAGRRLRLSPWAPPSASSSFRLACL